MPIRGCAMDWDRTKLKIVRVGKKSGPILSRLWIKVHRTLGQCRRPFMLSSTLAQLSMSHFVQKIFAKCRSRGKPNRCKSFFPGGMTPTVLQHIVSAV